MSGRNSKLKPEQLIFYLSIALANQILKGGAVIFNGLVLISILAGFSVSRADVIPVGKYVLKGIECSSGAQPALLNGYSVDAGKIPYAAIVLSENSLAISSIVKPQLSHSEESAYKKDIENVTKFREEMLRAPASAKQRNEIFEAEKFIKNREQSLSSPEQSRMVMADYLITENKLQFKKPLWTHVKFKGTRSALVHMEPFSIAYSLRKDELVFPDDQDPIFFREFSKLRCPAGDRASTIYKKVID